MRYLLDTNIWIYYLKFAEPIRTRLRLAPVHEIAVCSVVWAELLHGARKYGDPVRREDRVRRTLAPFHSLPFDDPATPFYATIRDRLEREGQIIGANDLLIAAIALAHDLSVVSGNREFSRVEGLKVENWLTE